MNTLTRIGGLAVAATLFALTASAQNRTFTNQYTFGDSLSDSGNLFAATTALGSPTPAGAYFQGRYSSGRVFTELLGNNLALTVTAPATVKTSMNFAFGGATAGGSTALPPSLSIQLGLFQARAITPARTDLFTVLFGANDLIPVLASPASASNPTALDTAGFNTAVTVAGGVQTLVNLGAKNIVVAGLPNLGATPRALAGGATGAALGLRAATAFNNELQSRLRALAATPAGADVNFLYVDLQGLLDRMILDYKALGFTNATSYVLAPAAAGGGGDPNNYIFFDDIHPTARGHAYLAQAIVEALNPEPVLGFAATQGTAALALQSISAAALDTRVAQIAGAKRGAGRADAYVSFNYGDGGRDADGPRRKFSYTAQVVTAGADVKVGDAFLVGASINTGRLNGKVTSGGGDYRMQDLTGRVYGVWASGPLALAVDGDYGALDVNDIHRATALGGFQTSGKTSGDHWGVGARASYGLDFTGFTLRPWAGVRNERVTLEAYTEKDVPMLTMDIDEQMARSTSGVVGVDLSTSTKLGSRPLRFDFRAAWHGEFSKQTRTVSGKLANNFTRTTPVGIEDGDGSGVELGGAATLFFAKTWSASLGYAGDVRSGDKVASRVSLSLQTGF